MDLPPQIDRHHLKGLRDLMVVKGLGLEGDGGSSNDGLNANTLGPDGPTKGNAAHNSQGGRGPIEVQRQDVRDAVRAHFQSDGFQYDSIGLEKSITKATCGLQILFQHPERGISLIEMGEDISMETSGWCSAVLIGEINRAAVRQVEKLKRQDACSQHMQLMVQSIQMLKWLWSILAERVATCVMTPWRWPAISRGKLLDRLHKALLWRITRVPGQGPGQGLHGGDLLHAMQLCVGSDVRLKDAEETLSQLFSDWRDWLRLSDQIRQEQENNSGRAGDASKPSPDSYETSGADDPQQVCNTADERFIHAACGWIDQTLRVARENIRDEQWPTRLQNSRRFLWELQRRINCRLVRRQKEWQAGRKQVFGKTPRGGKGATDS